MTAIRSLNVLAPVTPGSENALETCLRTLSPVVFGRMPSVHFARWVIVGETRLFRPRHRLRMKYLLLDVASSVRREEIVEVLRSGLGDIADDVWGHCVGYPTWRATERFRSWIAHNAVPVRAQFAAWPDLTPAEVRAALALRRRHIAFAVAAQDKDDVGLRADFLTRFGP